MKFHVAAPFEPMGDQPRAIDDLSSGIENGQQAQVLLGATGTGKTFTIAKVVERVQMPTLVIAHNKTLAAQLASSKIFSLIITLDILSAITIIISRKHICRQLIHTSPRMRQSMTKSIK